ncbi:MAG: DUF1992 domain-containing protein [bacterium]|nr:DUF1992 domain-containing protein [bacterium]
MFERPHSLIDELIKEAMEQGKFAHLPGEGKPLNLQEEAHIPEHLRMAHKLLKDNDLAPDWIVEGKELREARERLIKRLRREHRRYIKALDDAQTAPSPEITRRALHMAWDMTKAALRDETEQFNRRALGYNLRIPPGIPHLEMISFGREIA